MFFKPIFRKVIFIWNKEIFKTRAESGSDVKYHVRFRFKYHSLTVHVQHMTKRVTPKQEITKTRSN